VLRPRARSAFEDKKCATLPNDFRELWLRNPSETVGLQITVSTLLNQFPLRSAERNRSRDFLAGRRIPTEVRYPSPLHPQPALASLGLVASNNFRTRKLPAGKLCHYLSRAHRRAPIHRGPCYHGILRRGQLTVKIRVCTNGDFPGPKVETSRVKNSA